MKTSLRLSHTSLSIDKPVPTTRPANRDHRPASQAAYGRHPIHILTPSRLPPLTTSPHHTTLRATFLCFFLFSSSTHSPTSPPRLLYTFFPPSAPTTPPSPHHHGRRLRSRQPTGLSRLSLRHLFPSRQPGCSSKAFRNALSHLYSFNIHLERALRRLEHDNLFHSAWQRQRCTQSSQSRRHESRNDPTHEKLPHVKSRPSTA